MTLVACPSCGRPVSHRAEACVHCGYDLMPAPAGAVQARPVRVRRLRLVLGAVAGAAALLLLLGSFAAVASRGVRRADPPDVDADGGAHADVDELGIVDVLSHVLELQREHQAHFGTYTQNLTDTATDDFLGGFDAAMIPAGYTLEVLEAGADELCVQASPEVDAPAEARTLAIDETGAIHEGAGCTDEVAIAPPPLAAS
jgi:hypothetical protein